MVGINKRGTSVLRLFDESRDDYRAFFLFLFFIMKCGFGVICCLPPGRLIIPFFEYSLFILRRIAFLRHRKNS